MRAGENMIMLPVPLDLRTGITPVGESHRRGSHTNDPVPVLFGSDAQVPPSHCSVDARRGHQIRVSCVPIDVGNSAMMSVYGSVKRS